MQGVNFSSLLQIPHYRPCMESGTDMENSIPSRHLSQCLGYKPFTRDWQQWRKPHNEIIKWGKIKCGSKLWIMNKVLAAITMSILPYCANRMHWVSSRQHAYNAHKCGIDWLTDWLIDWVKFYILFSAPCVTPGVTGIIWCVFYINFLRYFHECKNHSSTSIAGLLDY